MEEKKSLIFLCQTLFCIILKKTFFNANFSNNISLQISKIIYKEQMSIS